MQKAGTIGAFARFGAQASNALRTGAYVSSAAAAFCMAAPALAAPDPKPGLDKINHIVVIYLENRSFDNLYGLFPGAAGVRDAGAAGVQRDKDGKPYATLPQAINNMVKPPQPDTRFPADLPNGPFQADVYAGLTQTTGDPLHRFYQQQYQINDGKMDRFVAWTNVGALVMSYHDGSHAPLWDYAKKYVLADQFFHAAFGGSFLNHMWLVCACTPVYKEAPARIVARLDANGVLEKDGAVTPDGYVVNTAFPAKGPAPKQLTDPAFLVPEQDFPHIGDRLSEKNISWAWYAGGWDDALAGEARSQFQFHHQPFGYFRSTALGTQAAKTHLKDEKDLLAAIVKGELEQVVFFKPIGAVNAHPGYTNVAAGERQTVELIKLIEKSPLWKDTLIIVTYDENGGFWDHVAPPKGDRWGPGARVPTLVISPHAKKGFIDSTIYDTTAILKLIETRFGLEPLGARDAAAADMTNALDLSPAADAPSAATPQPATPSTPSQ